MIPADTRITMFFSEAAGTDARMHLLQFSAARFPAMQRA
jgi:hypothetical protein